MKPFLFNLFLLMMHQAMTNGLDVLIRTLTTTSATIEWNNSISNSVSYLYRPSDTSQENVTNFANTTNRTINLTGLKPGLKYQLIVKNEGDEWNETITTASCPNNWYGFERSCYLLLSDIEMSWNNAARQCANFDSAHLAHPRSTAEIRFIRELLSKPIDGKTKPVTYWVGVHDKNRDSVMTYSNNASVSGNVEAFWSSCSRADGESINCISLVTASWNDNQQRTCVFGSCSHVAAGSVCQVSVSSSPHQVQVSSGTREADVFWEKPPSLHGSTFQKYNVTLASSTQPQVQSRMIDFAHRNMTFTNLIPGSLYFVFIHTYHQLDGEIRAQGGIFPSTAFVTEPLRPNNLSSTHITPTTATLTWSRPVNGSGLFHGFVVKNQALDGRNNSNFSYSGSILVDRNQQELTLKNLEPLVRYEVIVSSFVSYNATIKVSHMVMSEPSDAIIFQTLVSPPLSFYVSNFDSWSMTVEWESALGSVDYYLVSLYDVDRQLSGTTIHPSNITSSELKSLTPGAAYFVTISAFQNGIKSDDIELFQRIRPLSVATAQVSVLVESTSVQIYVNRHQATYSVYDGYNLTLESFDPPEIISWRIEKNITASWDSGTVSHLTPGRSYQLTIWVTSGKVKSHPSKIQNFTIGLEPPRNLRVKSRDETSLRLQWDPAPGDFENYLVSCNGDGGYNCSREFEEVEKSEGEELLVEKLVPGALYHFAVVAQQKLLRSEEAKLSTRTLPDSPTDVQLIETNTSAVSLRWQPAKHKQDKYHIEYKPVNKGVFYSGALPSEGFVDIPVSGPSVDPMTHIISGLLPGTSYELSIKTGSGDIESKPVEIEVATYPEAIHSLKFTDIGATWVMLSWKQGKGGTELYRLVLSAEEVFLSANQSMPHHTFKTLKSASLYTIKVSSLANGDESEVTELEIISRPLPPRDVLVENVTETSFAITWTNPASDWDNYLVTLTYVINSSRGSSKQLSGDVISLQYYINDEKIELDKLPAGGSYSALVESVFHNVSSSPVMRNITTYPHSVANLTLVESSAKQIKLEWVEPMGFNGGFVVEWTPKYGQVTVHPTNAILNDLTPGVLYTIQVFTMSLDRNFRSRSPAVVSVPTDEAEPDPPRNLTLHSYHNSSISVSWKIPDNPNGKLLFYIIRYQQLYPKPNINYDIINVTSAHLSKNITGLEPGGGYYISIASQNSAGVGEFTSHSLIQLVESTPGLVSELQATALSPSSISISWDPPQFPNGNITFYDVSVEDTSGNLFDVFELFVNEENSVGCLFDDLTDEEQLHYFGMTSVIFGHDDLYNETMYDGSAEDLPASSDRQQDSLLKGEFLPYCPVRIEVKGLLPYTNYSVSVSAWTSVGEGQRNRVIVETHQDVPGGPPRYLGASFVGARNITVAWYPPLMPNGELTYTIMLFAKDPNDDVTRMTTDTDIDLASLQPFTSYYMSINAASKAGKGPWSGLKEVQTLQGASDVVQNFDVTAISSRSVAVIWSSPQHPHGVVTAYVITVYDITMKEVYQQIVTVQNGQNSSEIPVVLALNPIAIIVAQDPEITANSSVNVPEVDREKLGSLLKQAVNESYRSVISDLLPFTKYYVSVAAENSAGVGASVPRSVLTLEDIPASPLVNLSYRNISSTSVNITWDDPVQANGIITNYTIGLVPPNEGIIKYDTENKYFVLKNLKKYSLYEVYVWPWTKVGEGPSTPKMLMHTDEDVPETPPLNISYTNISSTAIKVEWKAPVISNGRITHYTVYYSRNNETHQKDSTTSSLILDKLQAYGLYHITVTSSTRVGEGPIPSKVLWARLMEGQPATPPYNLTYSNITSRQVQVSWLAPVSPNGIIQYYDVNLTQMAPKNNYALLRTSNQTPSLLISSLEPYNHYQVVVRANTKYGDGDQASLPLFIWTLEDIPDSPPRMLQYENLTSSSIRMTWLPPSRPNGRITRYTLRYRPLLATVSEEFSVSGEDNQAVIAGLKKYSEYSFFLTSSTVVGEGPKANLSVLTDEDVPSSPPRNVIYQQLSSTAIMFSWQPPLEPNGIVLVYELFYSNNTLSLSTQTHDTNVTLSNLRKDGEYRAYVTARTRLGDGNQKSEKFTFRTLEDAPSDPPTNLEVKRVTSTSFELSWEPPKTPNGDILFYRLFYKLDNSTTQNIQIFGETSTSFSLDGLRKWSWYTMWVTASTGVGDGGLQSEDVRARTLEDVPDFPVANLTAFALSSDSIRASWKPTLPLTGTTYFRAFVSLLRAEQDDVVYEVTTNSTYLTASDLKPFTTYSVFVIPRVDGVNTDGPIDEVTVTTQEDKPASTVHHLHYHNLTSSSILLTWGPPHIPNGVITKYEIIIEPSMHQQVVSGDVTSVLIQNLQPYSNYTAVVSSYTSVGKGPDDKINFMTRQDIPSDSPRDIEIYNVSNTTAMLRWSPPFSPNGIVISYTTKISSSDGIIQLKSFEPSLKLIDLQPFKRYSISVAASTVAGTGPSSHPRKEFVTLESIPSEPQNLTCHALSEYEVNVQWERSEPSNGVIVNYTIKYEQVQDGNDSSPVTISSLTQEFLIEQLKPFTPYLISVAAATAIGRGPFATCNTSTLEGYPESPRNLTTTKVEETLLELTWHPPLQMNGNLLRYTLSYFPPDGCPDNSGSESAFIIEANQCQVDVSKLTKIQLRFLKKYTLYTITVRAETGKGYGAFSDPVQIQTNEGAPDYPPSSVHVVALSSTAINVTWREPPVLTGVTTYRVNSTNTETLEMVGGTELEYSQKKKFHIPAAFRPTLVRESSE